MYVLPLRYTTVIDLSRFVSKSRSSYTGAEAAPVFREAVAPAPGSGRHKIENAASRVQSPRHTDFMYVVIVR